VPKGCERAHDSAFKEPANRRAALRLGRKALPAGVLAGIAAAATLVAAVDPNEPGHYPTCPFLWVTGLYCPGCGSLRMVHALTHGHVGEAFGRNPLAFMLIPLAGYLWVRWVGCTARGEPMSSALLRPKAAWAFGALLVVYWVVRNLPVGQALAP
jgi:hypothetical protein